MSFNRWKSKDPTTWPFQIFNKYSTELSHMYIAQIGAKDYTYHHLGKVAKWEDKIDSHFQYSDPVHNRTFQNIKQWSDSYNEFDNWINLNTIMAISSNLETYLSKTIQLALESDLGILFGVSKRIDGIEILKYKGPTALNFEDKIVSCVKGEWNSRINSFIKIFGSAPTVLTDNVSEMEKIRKLRNNVGHAFGREIEESKRHDLINVNKSNRLSRERTIEYMKLIYGIAKEIDKQLLNNQIGEYQIVHFYHNLKDSLSTGDPFPEREHGNHTAVLKRKIGSFGVIPVGKKFCGELIDYYEAL